MAPLWFLGLQIGIATLLDAAPVSVRFPEAAPILEAARCADPGPDVVAFGSSRFKASIDNDRLDALLARRMGDERPRVLNAAVMAGEGHTIAFLSEAVRAAGVRPRVVVIEILPESVGRKVRSLEAALVRHFGWRDLLWALPDLVRSGQLDGALEARLNPAFRYRKEIVDWAATGFSFAPGACPEAPALGLADGSKVALDGPAPEPSTPQKTDEKRMRRELQKMGDQLEGYELGGSNQQALESVMARFHANGAAILLVAPPLASEHRALYDASTEEAFQAYIAELEDRYDARFVDWREALPDEEMFDNHHANDAGSRRFTALLAAELAQEGQQRVSERTD